MRGWWLVLALPGLVMGCDSSGTVAGVPDGSTDAAPLLDATSESIVEAGPGPCADAGTPPSTLSCTGLYADIATKQLAPNALAYTPSTPLWSDGAQKARWIELPSGTTIDISNPDEWTFPIGTKLFKEFRVNGQRVETRFFQKTTPTFWVYATYAWNSDDSDAIINFGGPVPVGNDGGTWNIPTNDDCDECHRGRQDRILGFEQVSLGLPGAQGLTLAQLAAQGLVTPPPTSVSLAFGDDGTGLDPLALGWIHVNCGVTCHNSNPTAAGYGAGMLLRLHAADLDGSPPDPATWDILKTTLNVPCVSGTVAGQPRIVPGDAADSVLYQLMDERGAIQMPPIGSLIVDTPDVAVVRAWIQALGAQDGGGPVTDGGGPDGASGFDGGGFDGGGHHGHDGGFSDAGEGDGSTDGQADGGTAADGSAGDDAGD
jgi:hypothetical protein